MQRLSLQLSKKEQQVLLRLSALCRELWNMTLQQRRNKYSWGKTSLATQEQELRELKQEFPEYQEPHHEVLLNVFRALEEAYQEFMPRRREKGVKPPAFKEQNEVYTQRYTGDSFQLKENQLKLSYAQTWLTIDLPLGDYSSVHTVEVGYDDQWWLSLKNE